MSNILRHAAHAFRIVLQPDGFANLSDVLNACNRTIDEGLNVARTSRKYGQARQELRDDPRQGLMIRATRKATQQLPGARGRWGGPPAFTLQHALEEPGSSGVEAEGQRGDPGLHSAAARGPPSPPPRPPPEGAAGEAKLHSQYGRIAAARQQAAQARKRSPNSSRQVRPSWTANPTCRLGPRN